MSKPTSPQGETPPKWPDDFGEHQFIGESCSRCGIPFSLTGGYVVGGKCPKNPPAPSPVTETPQADPLLARAKRRIDELTNYSGNTPGQDVDLINSLYALTCGLNQAKQEAAEEMEKVRAERDASRRVAEAQHEALLRFASKLETAEAERDEWKALYSRKDELYQNAFQQWEALEANLVTLRAALEQAQHHAKGLADVAMERAIERDQSQTALSRAQQEIEKLTNTRSTK
jgi:hypothetical protein